jgi:hypothetical protein
MTLSPSTSESVKEEEEICYMLNIRMSRTPIEGSPVSHGADVDESDAVLT